VGGAWTTRHGRRLKVLRTAVPPTGDGPLVPAGDGPVELVEVQPEGKAAMAATDWARGARWEPGERLPS
jgi:methionyl-tRNA formyltransferase